ncbi:hypothetical protein [Paenibacillus eucommiae]|uniref:Uncharacterized protein n=1 Tax=Paenibacillus eucommiae TaxID=1355755 RepID=A0ABS4J948_9BACL|nr:hypothetical protein [Paenibacillus eucommiae]MBP1996369.1 hypothetical protein [Paenibacillus eucommiae]
METVSVNNEEEILLSHQTRELWVRRELEVEAWVKRSMPPAIRPKQTLLLDDIAVDAELYTALLLLKQLQIRTEFSCAGVSILDEPIDHSLYAYITILTTENTAEQTERFVHHAMHRMKQRLLVTYEPERNRYDLSSFFINHNRSFCTLIQGCAESFALKTPSAPI